jgi:thiol-disulfide isomerase/thioredoxin
MSQRVLFVLLLGAVLMISFCSKEVEVSPERYKALLDTLLTDPEYDTYMDASYELSKYYPQEQAVPRIMLNAFERALMEQDADRFDALFEILKNYPENGALSISDQIAFGNRIAWDMTEQMYLFNKAPEVMAYTFETFEANEAGLQWKDEIGAMIHDTQGNVYERMDEPGKAIVSYGKALEFFEQPETYLRRGLIYESLDSLELALDDFIGAMSMAPNQGMIITKVKESYGVLNPGADVDQFLADLLESFMEKRREEVLAESFSMNAPAYEFTDMQGNVLNNETMKGKVVFVDFWATWCNPCRRELPEFQRFYDMHKKNPKVAFVAASTDSDKSKVAPYIAAEKYTFPVAYAEMNANNFGVEGIPSLFIIGPDGKIRYKIVGFDPDKDFVREMTWRLESLLY